MTLSARSRLTRSAKKRVHHAAQVQKVAQPSDDGGDSGIGGCFRDAGRIGPRCRKVQATAVRQLHTQLQHARSFLSADHSQDTPFMGVSLTGDRHTNWKAVKRGSLI
jgi:hypothetical protein